MMLEVVFLTLSALILGSAVMVLRAREIVHATIWLAALLVGVAGIFVTLGAEFLATIQILVYVGAVITLILFTVMLTIPEDRTAEYLDNLKLPPGVSIESVEELQRAVPAWTGSGPYKNLQDTNPRVPLAEPKDLYGVSLVDDTYASRVSPRDKTKKEGGQ